MSSFNALKESTVFRSPIISTVEFSPSVVCTYLQSLDVSKACGPDLIPAFLLKHSADVISYPLSYLSLVLCLRTGCVLMLSLFISGVINNLQTIIVQLALRPLLLRLWNVSSILKYCHL